MSLLPETFAVFVLTHGRPDNVVTVKALDAGAYSGRLFFVVDNEDKHVAAYQEKFGRERVIVFNKGRVADACDEGNNFDERRTILMARNACFEIAPILGVTHFLQLDDDYADFRFKTPETDNSLFIVKDLNRFFLALVECYERTGATSIALAQGGDFLGGITNDAGSYRFQRRKCMNSFFCSTERKFQFVGAMNEDVNTYTVRGSRGALFLTIPLAAIQQKQTQSQKGGITEMYQRFGTYCKAFTTAMMMPSSVKVSMMRSNNPRIHHSIDWKKTVPCIIRENHRKQNPKAGRAAGAGGVGENATPKEATDNEKLRQDAP